MRRNDHGRARRATAHGATAHGATARGASAFGAAAVGALAVGSVAIGRAAIGRLAVGRARVRRLRIDELVVGELRMALATRERAAAWIAAYERAWRTPGTHVLTELFTEQATYRPNPFVDPLTGLDAIARFWETEREGPDEPFALASELAAVEGSVAVARIEVAYERPAAVFRDMWVIDFAPDGRCRAFEEWPFAPAGAAG